MLARARPGRPPATAAHRERRSAHAGERSIPAPPTASTPGLFVLIAPHVAAGYPPRGGRSRPRLLLFNTCDRGRAHAGALPAPARRRGPAGRRSSSPARPRSPGRWALALIASFRPPQIGAVPLGMLAEHGPALCAADRSGRSAQRRRPRAPDAAAARAVEAGSRRAAAARPRSPARRDGRGLARARSRRSAVSSSGVRWSAELGPPSGARARWTLCDRLAHVCAAARSRRRSSTAAVVRRAGARAAAAEPPPPGSGVPAARGPRAGAAIIVDELEQASPDGRRLRRPDACSEPPGMEIEIRDQRGEPGPAAWIAAIGRKLDDSAATPAVRRAAGRAAAPGRDGRAAGGGRARRPARARAGRRALRPRARSVRAPPPG